MNYKLIFFFIFVIILLLYYNEYNRPSDKAEIIKTLIRQAARWSVAATQDQNAMIAVLHANYGAGYLWALKDIATDNEIEDATGINILQFRDNIIKIQDKSTKQMAKICPQYAPKDSYLLHIAGDI